ncbi:MAG: DUF4328 domain-containing protein [Capsulimonas sp.]|uniref:DUF4328 domain-containing protein n=1 Tax=Capsulimonas sp. TaxID=2494211 RepID=UPI003262D9BC
MDNRIGHNGVRGERMQDKRAELSYNSTKIMSTTPPPPPDPVSVWPPPPVVAEDNRRSRLCSMLANYISTAGLARGVVGTKILEIVLGAATVVVWIAGWTLPQPSNFIDPLSAASATALLIQNILSLIWMYRLYKNTAMLGVSALRYTPWSVVAFQIIPVVNLIVPYLALREVWRVTASDAELAAAGGEWGQVRASALLSVCWGVSILVTIGSYAHGVYAMTAGGSRPTLIVLGLADIILHILGIFVVLLFTRRQETRYAETAAALYYETA